MGLFDIFTSQPATQPATQQPASPQQQQPGAPGNIPNPGEAGAAPATTNGGTLPAAPTEPADNSPLATFKDLWEPIPTDPNAPSDTAPKPLSAEDVQKVVSKVDFTSMLGQETLASIAAGGEEAQKAFQQAMNTVAQQVMVQSTMVSNKLTEQAVAAAVAKQMKELPSLLREQSIANHSAESNPIFKNPAVKPIIESTQKQLAQKFPNATPQEIATMTKNYIIAMGEAFGPPPATNKSEDGTDWEAFLRP